ncbi:MAG: HD domain-containing protein [Sedimentisphaerales bacterium]|nr:HD domain-containing protein [Sedimentisphaerales bacterium]
MADMNGKNISSSELHELEIFGSRVNKYGANFAFYKTDGELALLLKSGRFDSNRELLKKYGQQALNQNSHTDQTKDFFSQVMQFGDTNHVMAVILNSSCFNTRRGEAVGVAMIDVGEASPAHIVKTGTDAGDANPMRIGNKYFVEMLGLLAKQFQNKMESEKQIEMVSTELARVYEELVLLHKISTNMRVTEADSNFLQMACDSLTEIIFVEGIAVLLEKTIENEQQLVIAAGSGLIDMDEQMAAILHGRIIEEINSGKEALLDSEVDSPFRYDWPDNIRNIIAVPLCGKEKVESHIAGRIKNDNYIIGFMVAINRVGKQDFDSTDVKLFNSVASGCAVFIENGRLFKDLKELFIGSLKALTSSIDAKDKYTHGHSERVAFISRWIAERLSEHEPLKEEEINEIYMAGLLHDIGKIGIDEAVLRKNGRLTEQEFARIKTHPSIGAGILREIKQMREIVSGVLCHHERVDGKGYPNGLTGEKIPLTGKIVGLADSFDAMTSKRTYRDAMTVEQALAEIEKGLGTQFDEKIGRIFLDSDVYSLWDSIRDGLGEITQSGVYAEYDTAAVETLIR